MTALTENHKHALRIAADLLKARGCHIPEGDQFYPTIAKVWGNRSDREQIVDEVDWVLDYDAECDKQLANGESKFDWRKKKPWNY